MATLLAVWTKAKEYTTHFVISAAILLGLVGFASHLETVRQLNEQIYAISHANSALVVSTPPKKSVIDHIINKKVLPPAPVPTDTIGSVVEIVQKSTACPPVVITVLKNGNVVSNNPSITQIISENYQDTFTGTDLMLRGAGLVYAGEKGYKVSGDYALQASYWRVWRLYPDVTVAGHSIGGGISYHHEWGIFKNTYGGLGYSYHWNEGYWGPYAAVSVRF